MNIQMDVYAYQSSISIFNSVPFVLNVGGWISYPLNIVSTDSFVILYADTLYLNATAIQNDDQFPLEMTLHTNDQNDFGMVMKLPPMPSKWDVYDVDRFDFVTIYMHSKKQFNFQTKFRGSLGKGKGKGKKYGKKIDETYCFLDEWKKIGNRQFEQKCRMNRGTFGNNTGLNDIPTILSALSAPLSHMFYFSLHKFAARFPLE